jgi:hypothetical protein
MNKLAFVVLYICCISHLFLIPCYNAYCVPFVCSPPSYLTHILVLHAAKFS